MQRDALEHISYESERFRLGANFFARRAFVKAAFEARPFVLMRRTVRCSPALHVRAISVAAVADHGAHAVASCAALLDCDASEPFAFDFFAVRLRTAFCFASTASRVSVRLTKPAFLSLASVSWV